MGDTFTDRPFPRGPLIGAGVMIALTLAAASAARFTGIGVTQLPPAPTVEVRDLRFADRDDGSVLITEPSGTQVAVLEPGSNGFIRGVMRGLARDRKLRGVGAEEPFRLMLRTNGHLVLEDPTTGRQIGLDAFGPTNAGAFADLLRIRSEKK